MIMASSSSGGYIESESSNKATEIKVDVVETQEKPRLVEERKKNYGHRAMRTMECMSVSDTEVIPSRPSENNTTKYRGLRNKTPVPCS